MISLKNLTVHLGDKDVLKDIDLKINLPRVDYWIGVGAQLSDRVHSLVKLAKKHTKEIA